MHYLRVYVNYNRLNGFILFHASFAFNDYNLEFTTKKHFTNILIVKFAARIVDIKSSFIYNIVFLLQFKYNILQQEANFQLWKLYHLELPNRTHN